MPLLRYVSAVLLFGLMLVTCVDVFGRYLLNRPLPGGFEITEMALAALIFTALPLVTLDNDHVTVDLFDTVTPDWLFRIQHVVACAIGFVCVAFLSYRLWIRAVNLDHAGQITAQLEIKISWLAYAMSTLMALSAVALVILAFRQPQRHHTGGDI